MKITTTRRLAAITVAATTATALVACGSDDTETATPAADTGIQEPATETAADQLRETDYLGDGDTLTATSESTDGVYTLAVTGSNAGCVDVAWGIDTPSSADAAQTLNDFAETAVDQALQWEYGTAGSPLTGMKFHLVNDGVLDETDAPAEEVDDGPMFDREAKTATRAFCLTDPVDAEAVVVDASMDGTPDSDSRGWLIEL